MSVYGIDYGRIGVSEIEAVKEEIDCLQMGTIGGPDYNERWSPERLERRLRLCTTYGMVGIARDSEGNLAGACFGMPTQLSDTGRRLTETLGIDSDDSFFAAGLFVSEAHQRKGIGSRLIEQRLYYFLERGFVSFAAITNAFGKQLELYRKLGYRISESQIIPGLNNPKVFVHGNIREVLVTSFGADPLALPMPLPAMAEPMAIAV